MLPSDHTAPAQFTTTTDARPALLEACQAALAWIDAIERDDGTANLDRLYFRWSTLMRATVRQVAGQADRR